MDRVHIKTAPKLFDLAVANIQKALGAQFGWLNNVFGIVELLTDMKNGKRFISANMYQGKNKYLQVMPCKELGNFCYFLLRDPQRVSANKKTITSPFSFVVWYNVDNVTDSPDERNREAVKAEILAFLSRLNIGNGRITLGAVYENPKNVFIDVSYDHVDNQFLMAPYAGLRIDGEISVVIPCSSGGDFNNDFNEDFLGGMKVRVGLDSFSKDFNEDFEK